MITLLDYILASLDKIMRTNGPVKGIHILFNGLFTYLELEEKWIMCIIKMLEGTQNIVEASTVDGWLIKILSKP